MPDWLSICSGFHVSFLATMHLFRVQQCPKHNQCPSHQAGSFHSSYTQASYKLSLATQSCSLFSPIPLLHPFSACVGSACQQSLETCSNLDPLPNKGLQTWDDFHLPWFFSIDLGKGAEAGFTGNSAPLLESLCWQLNPRILSLECNRSWTAFILGGKNSKLY